jgi:hypothetical protein
MAYAMPYPLMVIVVQVAHLVQISVLEADLVTGNNAHCYWNSTDMLTLWIAVLSTDTVEAVVFGVILATVILCLVIAHQPLLTAPVE